MDKMEIKNELLMFLSKQDFDAAVATKKDIVITSEAKATIDGIKEPGAMMAIYYTNPNIIIIKAELVTPENFANYLKG